MAWTIVLTAALTALAVVLAMNFSTPEKKIERKIEHRHAIADPQFRREMSVLLGPAILPGNKVIDYKWRRDLPASARSPRRGDYHFETYIYWSARSPRFADALC